MKRARIVILVLTLVACGKLPPTHYYVLEPPRASFDATSTGGRHAEQGVDLGVEPFEIDPPYDQNRIVYRIGKTSPEVAFYAYHRWAAPLSRMLPRVAAAALRGTRGVRSVEPTAHGGDYDALLHGRVQALEEVDTVEGQTVRVRMRLVLREPDGRELWSETIAGEATLRTDDVADIVERMNSVLSGSFREARVSLAKALR